MHAGVGLDSDARHRGDSSPKHQTPNTKHQTRNPKPQTLNPILNSNPKPYTLYPKQDVIQAPGLAATIAGMSFFDPLLVPPLLRWVGPVPVLVWTVHFTSKYSWVRI